MAERFLSSPLLAELAQEFEQFQARLTGDGSLDPLYRLAEDLTSEFPSDPARTPAAATAGPCGTGRS